MATHVYDIMKDLDDVFPTTWPVNELFCYIYLCTVFGVREHMPSIAVVYVLVYSVHHITLCSTVIVYSCNGGIINAYLPKFDFNCMDENKSTFDK